MRSRSNVVNTGKTTTAQLVCQELGFDVVELNASDTRSKRSLGEEVAQQLSNTSLGNYTAGKVTDYQLFKIAIMTTLRPGGSQLWIRLD